MEAASEAAETAIFPYYPVAGDKYGQGIGAASLPHRSCLGGAAYPPGQPLVGPGLTVRDFSHGVPDPLLKWCSPEKIEWNCEFHLMSGKISSQGFFQRREDRIIFLKLHFASGLQNVKIFGPVLSAEGQEAYSSCGSCRIEISNG